MTKVQEMKLKLVILLKILIIIIIFAPIVSYCSININRIDKTLTDVYGDKCEYMKKKNEKMTFYYGFRSLY